MAQVHQRPKIAGRLLVRDEKGRPIFTASVSEASWTESRDLGNDTMDFEIRVERDYRFQQPVDRYAGPASPALSNAHIWSEIEALERMHTNRDITFEYFIRQRNILIGRLQGPINKERLRGEVSNLVVIDESSDLSHYRDAKRAMFGALYGGGGIALRDWANTAQKLTVAKHAALVGVFNETTPGGASRRNYLFDLEDRW